MGIELGEAVTTRAVPQRVGRVVEAVGKKEWKVEFKLKPGGRTKYTEILKSGQLMLGDRLKKEIEEDDSNESLIAFEEENNTDDDSYDDDDSIFEKFWLLGQERAKFEILLKIADKTF